MCIAIELSSDLRDTVNTIRKTNNELNKELSQIDKLITDIKHEIEFGKFDVFRGYKKFKQLQEALHKRRIIKDEVELIEPLIRYTGSIEKSVDKVYTAVVNKELNFKNRKYTPRVLKGELNIS